MRASVVTPRDMSAPKGILRVCPAYLPVVNEPPALEDIDRGLIWLCHAARVIPPRGQHVPLFSVYGLV